MIEADKFLEVTFILKSLENFILVKFYQAFFHSKIVYLKMVCAEQLQ